MVTAVSPLILSPQILTDLKLYKLGVVSSLFTMSLSTYMEEYRMTEHSSCTTSQANLLAGLPLSAVAHALVLHQRIF